MFNLFKKKKLSSREKIYNLLLKYDGELIHIELIAEILGLTYREVVANLLQLQKYGKIEKVRIEDCNYYKIYNY